MLSSKDRAPVMHVAAAVAERLLTYLLGHRSRARSHLVCGRAPAGLRRYPGAGLSPIFREFPGSLRDAR